MLPDTAGSSKTASKESAPSTQPKPTVVPPRMPGMDIPIFTEQFLEHNKSRLTVRFRSTSSLAGSSFCCHHDDARVWKLEILWLFCVKCSLVFIPGFR